MSFTSPRGRRAGGRGGGVRVKLDCDTTPPSKRLSATMSGGFSPTDEPLSPTPDLDITNYWKSRYAEWKMDEAAKKWIRRMTGSAEKMADRNLDEISGCVLDQSDSQEWHRADIFRVSKSQIKERSSKN
ncbi:unnamed protein product [Camellia sinensis]